MGSLTAAPCAQDLFCRNLFSPFPPLHIFILSEASCRTKIGDIGLKFRGEGG